MAWDYRKLGTRICVCFDVTNSDALRQWQASPAPSVGALTQNFSCGNNCGMCIPYFQELLADYQRGCWPDKDTEHGKEILADEGRARGLFD